MMSEKIDELLPRIEAALARGGRSMDDLLILLATKTRTAQEIREAVELFEKRGVKVDVGENRQQEFAKHAELEDLHEAGVMRHYIGTIQSNKARDISRFADLVHSIDRESALTSIEKRAANDGKVQRVLIQVNTSGEESKGGYEPDLGLLREVAERCAESDSLALEGLMTIGTNTDDEVEIRRSLRQLRELRDGLGIEAVKELSMGMSNDLEIAIEEGATIVRVGSAVFGPRDYSH
ncbi:YggS family pyridoxal phosphate-dependent enzyme [Dermabacter sp. HMSC08H10]|uniref:YggS family pyridoxal phosphate-dependent enzyme n=1 Tax=Dermabacter sp. HMSC08H10 TaxID=1581144 RepID=UPI0008C5CF31|nr:YggS family pyridoxal phosphate-dependent enzyme [Dermabacter sp. HMSC08H10]OFT20192.1 YggS family pyridoxal phosphate enzyme [Dermabacter sp. HMSC08H10]